MVEIEQKEQNANEKAAWAHNLVAAGGRRVERKSGKRVLYMK